MVVRTISIFGLYPFLDYIPSWIISVFGSYPYLDDSRFGSHPFMDDICFRIIYKNTDYIKKGILNRKVRIRMKEILYKSTRSDDAPVSASKAILMGLAKDGGLFVPTAFPTLDVSLADLAKLDDRVGAYEVVKLMLSH